MLRLSLFLLLSLALHVAGWLLHGEAQPPALSAAQTREAPQVLRLAAVLQQAEPAPAKLPEQPQPQPQPQRQAVVPRKSPAPKPVVQAPVAKATPAVAAQPTQNQPVQAQPTESTRQSAAVRAAAQAAPAKPVATKPVAEVLSRKPSFREPPRQPNYPSQARRRNQQGVVLVEVRLDERGQQRSLNVLRSSGVDSLDRAALEAVAKWRFRPETTGGQAVPSRVQIPIQFALTASR
ncbi:Ferric siderophore transport system, periplasmic binding protein TonB [Pseudomonas sp. 9AZ]|uniref:energy transducer TonB n=1 Tax=Pseudomonas sp. 9AZ TaxID=2653168 RepID=UPI0012F47079|nr:energy transducer TonB [Pseudomonas sp. 9AZ]VXC98796.1 Ferric siderophore transport system, periplasmic binding protein TonB [Pseudomonas sp. 9AZ]